MLPSQVNVSMKLHVFSSCCALTGSDGGEKKKREGAVQRVTMTGPLAGLVVSVSGLSCGQWATVVAEEHC